MFLLGFGCGVIFTLLVSFIIARFLTNSLGGAAGLSDPLDDELEVNDGHSTSKD
jgi:hypothetical protein